MRNLAKIFISIVAMAVTISCTTDATDDLAIKGMGKTTLTLSLDGSRTQLGEAVDGTYPLTWSEGDQVSINGVASDALTAEEAGKADATFHFTTTEPLATPYFVAYPAAEANQVVFPATQFKPQEGNIENNVTVLYGYSANGKNVKLNHLTGLLKIGIKGSANLTYAQISTINRAPIAGAFEAVKKLDTVNDEEYFEFVPTKSANEVITYYFDSVGLPITLSEEEATYMYVAVPAGTYDELYITLYDSDYGVMYATAKAGDSKPLAAGKVRAFSTDIFYEPTSTVDKFVIASYSDLAAFKNRIEAAEATLANADATDEEKSAATATLAMNAVVVSDIKVDETSMNAIAKWSSIQAPNYMGTIYGNGFEIEGLPSPLFDTTAASFRGLHISTSINETNNPLFGVFARKLIATTNAPIIESCSVKGAITLDCKDYIPTSTDSFENVSAGAFIGYGYGVAFKSCTNYANFNINKLVSESDTGNRYGAVAGFVAYTDVANDLFVSFDNCHNKGNITYAEGAQSGVRMNFGGLVGAYYGADAVATFNNCSNSGNITINANTRGGYIGGIIGYIKASSTSPKTLTFTNKTSNTGTIKVEGTCASATMVGGIVGNSDLYNNFIFEGRTKNDASITVNGNVTGETYVGGIFGAFTSECKAVFKGYTENTEYGELKINGNSTGKACVGGIIGFADTNTSQSTNGIFIEGATVTNNAALSINGTTYGHQVFLAGVVASSQNTAHNFSQGGKFVNHGKLVMNNGAKAAQVIRIGGVTGYMYNDSAVLVDTNTDTGYMYNTGDIEFRGSAEQHLDIGGIFGRIRYGIALTSVVNTGNIKAYGAFTEKYSTGSSKNNVRVGGIVGYSGTDASSAIKNVQCYCNIEAYTITKSGDSYTFTSYPLVGMISGNPTPFTVVENTQIGGKVATTATVVDGVVTPTWSELTSTNCYDYVYGLRTGLTEFTGISHLAEKPKVK